MSDRVIELEAGVDPAEQLLRRYDPVAATWDLDKTGEFWESVALAHDMGRFGQGRRVGVIDASFDPTVPALVPHDLRAPASPDSTAHGTAVALLVLEVAPRAELLLYPISRDGTLEYDLVADAITDAVDQGAQIINLSLGRRIPVSDLFDIDRFLADAPDRGAATTEDLRYWAARKAALADVRDSLEIESDRLTEAVERAASAGVVVVAAAGNDAEHFFVPAAMPHTISVGFTRVRKQLDEGMESVELRVPTFTQSVLTDFNILQPSGVVGSSFASPLITGLAAVAQDPRDLVAIKAAARRSGWATDLWRNSEQVEWRPERQGVIDDLFKAAVNEAPHQHHWSQRRYPCPECAFLLGPTFTNFGLFALSWNDHAQAQRLFEAVRWFAPDRYEAPANLAVARRELAHASAGIERTRLLAAACEASAASIARRPDHQPYTETFLDLVSEFSEAISQQKEAMP